MSKTINIYYDPVCLEHDMGYGHPEQPPRISVIREHLLSSDMADSLNWLTPEQATREQLCQAHTTDYVEMIYATAPEQGLQFLDPDTSMSPGSLASALTATGAAISAIDGLRDGAGPVFCLTRPPGHHAESYRAMGFCIFNHIAIAACYAQQQGFERIAIADFDVHHGNGTEEILSGKPDILFLSSFQSPFYPFSGTGETAANIINSPYQSGFTGQAFRDLVTSVWQPALTEFRPDLLLISAGFDAHAADPISQANLDEEDYYWVSEQLQRWTHDSTRGKVVSILEGGYNLSVLGPCTEAHLRGLTA